MLKDMEISPTKYFNTDILKCVSTWDKDGLSYSMYGYSQDLASNGFEDLTSGAHSPIIGWAYDGNPIYGPFGYIDPDDTQSTTTIIRPGYELDTSAVFDNLQINSLQDSLSKITSTIIVVNSMNIMVDSAKLQSFLMEPMLIL